MPLKGLMDTKKIGPIIAVDRGATCTDFGVVENFKLKDKNEINGRDWGEIEDVFREYISKTKTSHMVFSGSAAGMPDFIKEKVTIVPEIDSVGFGGAVSAGFDDCVVVSMGTGTAVVRFKDDVVSHLGGTGVGGGTLRGLSQLLLGEDDHLVTEKMAMEGDFTQMNLTISDLGYADLSYLPGDMTASNFASIKSSKKEDYSAGIHNLIGEAVGVIASLCARQVGCEDKIVVIGKVAKNEAIRFNLNRVGELFQTTFIFPDNPGHATVFGAAMKYCHQLGIR